MPITFQTKKINRRDFQKLEFPYYSHTVTPKKILHFKSECSLIDNDVILVSSKMAKLEYLKSNYNLIELPIGEEGAANSLRINDKVIVPDGFSKAEEI